MKIQISYIESDITISDNFVNSMEVENRDCFYRVVNDFVVSGNSDDGDSLTLLDECGKEIGISNKILVVIDYFNFDNLVRKYVSHLEKEIVLSFGDKDMDKLLTYSNKLIKCFEHVVSDFDLPIKIGFSGDVSSLVKFMKLSFSLKDNLLDNLFLLIDLEKVFCLHKVLVLINLKQYLSKTDLVELYKYSIYKSVNILLIDSQAYGCTLEYEKKVIIDSDFNEYVI